MFFLPGNITNPLLKNAHYLPAFGLPASLLDGKSARTTASFCTYPEELGLDKCIYAACGCSLIWTLSGA